MNTTRTSTNDTGPEGLILVLLFVASCCGAVIWAGAQLASLVRYRRGFPVATNDVLHALATLPKVMSQPEEAWPPEVSATLPGPLLYWLCTFVVFAVVVSLAVVLVRVFRPRHEPLDRRERLGVKTNARFANKHDLRPLLSKTVPPDRLLLGKFGRKYVVTEAHRTHKSKPGRDFSNGRGGVAIVGPSRSGKSTLAKSQIEHWGGPAIIVSVKSDLLDGTIDRRSSLPGADVKVFDPTNSARLGTSTWSPLRGCNTREGAMRAASQLVKSAPSSSTIEGGDHWRKQAEILLSGMLAVARGTNKTMHDVARWIAAEDRPSEQRVGEVHPLVKQLTASKDPDHQDLGRFATMTLLGLWQKEPRSISPVYSTAANIVWPWIDLGIAASAASCDIDLDWLCAGPNTLYVVAPLIDHDRSAGVLGGLIGDLVAQVNQRNLRGEPIESEILLLIDEAGNMRLDDLPIWASTLAGMGVQLETIWQSIAQIKAKYGARSDVLLTNFLTKLWFPGMSDLDGLGYVEGISGDEHVPHTLTSVRRRFEPLSPATLPIVQRRTLREMPPGTALLHHGSLPPTRVGVPKPLVPVA
jgi:type IV secretion system protein VirD4